MQSLVPRAIVIIEFGAEGDNCAVAKYNATKMADKQSILSRFLNNLRAKIFRKIHRHASGISVYIVDRSTSKSAPLNSRLVLNSLKYFRSISTASDVHDHFLSLFVTDSHAKDDFRFPCDFFDSSTWQALFHIFPSRAAFPRTLVDNWFMII